MKWVNVHKTNSVIEAELLANTLDNHGIQAVVLNKKVSGYLVGYVEVNVLEQFQTEAEAIIQAHLSAI